MHEFPKTNHATFLYPTACLPLPFSMQWWGVHAVVVITCGWCFAKKRNRNIHAEDTTSHVEKTKENTKRKQTKKKNKEVPGFELTNFDCMVCCFNPYATVA